MDILFEDESIIVVNKPAGIATEGAKFPESDMESELRKYRKQKGESTEIYTVHRLDKPVSGIVVFAKTENAAAKLSKALGTDAFKKEYEALVLKNPDAPDMALLTDYLVRDAKTNISRVASEKENGAKLAKLSYTVIEEDDETFKVRVTLYSGRHHQIRVQMANAGMPIIGDQKYGNSRTKEIAEKRKLKNVQLSAVSLSFPHPISGKQMSFTIQAL